MPPIKRGNGALEDGRHKQFVFLSQELLFYEARNVRKNNFENCLRSVRKNNFENCLGILVIIVKGSIW